MLADYSMA
jgi:hypothetical protein